MAFAVLFITWGISSAEWHLYDNFDDGSGIINPNRWDIQNGDNIIITNDGGRAKFEHNTNSGTPNSAYLIFNQSPESIKAIRLNLSVMGQVENCGGDFRAIIGGWLGKSDNTTIYPPYFWHEMSLEIDKKAISGRIYNSPDDFDEVYELFWGKLWTEPHLIYENVYYVTISFLKENGVTYSMEDLHEHRGTVTYTLPMNILPTDNHFKGIGTISESGNGHCTVFVDDVEVLRDEDCQDITIVNTYSPPPMYSFGHGLAFDGANLWAVQFEPGLIKKLQLNPDFTTSVIDTIDIMDGDENVCMGLTFQDDNLWVPCNYHGEPSPTLYKITQTGKIKSSFPVPDGGDSTGLTFDGKYLWNAGFGVGIRKINKDGELVAIYPSPGNEPAALAFDGQNLWHSDLQANRIYKLDTTGNVICSYRGPGSYPLGLTFDGTHLWVLDTDGIYQMDINPQ
jgi:hypothetical protein